MGFEAAGISAASSLTILTSVQLDNIGVESLGVDFGASRRAKAFCQGHGVLLQCSRVEDVNLVKGDSNPMC